MSATAHAGLAGGATDTNAGIRKIDLQAWRSIRALRGGMRRADCHDQRGVHHGTFRGRPLRPRVMAAGGDAQDAVHHGNGVTGPVLAHEWEPFGGITSVSRAQAAAFERILALQLELAVLTPQTVELLALCRRQAIRAAALVTVGLRDPVAIACADGSNSFASSSGVRPARTSSIICRRNSGAYGARFLAIVDFRKFQRSGVHETGSTSVAP